MKKSLCLAPLVKWCTAWILWIPRQALWDFLGSWAIDKILQHVKVSFQGSSWLCYGSFVSSGTAGDLVHNYHHQQPEMFSYPLGNCTQVKQNLWCFCRKEFHEESVWSSWSLKGRTFRTDLWMKVARKKSHFTLKLLYSWLIIALMIVERLECCRSKA